MAGEGLSHRWDAQDVSTTSGLYCLVQCVPVFIGGFDFPIRALNYVLEIFFIFFTYFLFAVMSVQLFV